jgi:plastocyanin
VKSLVMSRALRVLVAAPALVGLTIARGSAAGAPLATHTVTIEGAAFTAAELTVRTGDVIVWVNTDPFPHTATSSTAGFDSSAIAPEKSWRYRAAKAGDFPYICTIHPSMTGTLHVK